MPPKIGLQVPLDLSLESMLSVSAPVVKQEESAPVQATPEPVKQEESKESKKVSRNKASLTWKQTGFSLSDATMTRLRLEAFKTGRTMSQVAEQLLSRHLPNHRIAS